MSHIKIARDHQECVRQGEAIAEMIRITVIGYLRAGHVVDAIKFYKKATNKGLAESKHAVERIRASVDPEYARNYIDPDTVSYLTRISFDPDKLGYTHRVY